MQTADTGNRKLTAVGWGGQLLNEWDLLKDGCYCLCWDVSVAWLQRFLKRLDTTAGVLCFSAEDFKCRVPAATPRLVSVLVCACETQCFSGQVEPVVSAEHAEFSLVVVTNRQTKT